MKSPCRTVTVYLEVRRAFGDLELEIEGTYTPGEAPSSWHPGSGTEVEVDGIRFADTGLPWHGELTEEELALVNERLLVAADEDAHDADSEHDDHCDDGWDDERYGDFDSEAA